MVSEWYKFEQYCERFLRDSFRDSKWKIDSQVRKTYNDGAAKRIDFHVRQKRQGGQHLVFDAKYYIRSTLPTKAVTDTFEYKRRSRASAAAILCPQETKIADSAKRKAKELGVEIISVRYFKENTRNYDKLLNRIKIVSATEGKVNSDDDPWWKL